MKNPSKDISESDENDKTNNNCIIIDNNKQEI